MKPREILNYFERRRDSMVADIRELVEIESPSHNAEQSVKLVSKIEEMAREIPMDLTIERLEAEAYGEHLVIRAFPSTKKQVLVLGHTDTVHPIDTKLKNPARIEGDRFYGCGIFDMKANIVVMVEVLRYLASVGMRPSRPVTILLSCDEEVGSRTGRPVVEREAAASERCLVLEPSFEGKVKTARKGTGLFTLHAHGVPAHAGLEPHRGASAILELSHQIETLHALNDLSAGTTVNVCTVRGGTTSNVIPEYAECEIDVRFSAADEATRVENAIRNLAPRDARVSLELTGGINRPPMERTRSTAELFHKARSLAAEFGYELGEIAVGGASDGNFVAALGVPVLDGLGVTGDGAHTQTEHILVGDLAPRTTLITCLIANSDR